MSEEAIASNANVFSFTRFTPHSWICRDDSGYYWAIFEELDGDIAVYKNDGSGGAWVLKKTLTDADFTGTPFPMDDWQIINLDGQDAVYITLRKAGKIYSYEINTTTDIGAVDLDNSQPGGLSTNDPIYIRWNSNDNKIYMNYHIASYNYTDFVEITRSAGFGTPAQPVVGTNLRNLDFCIDSNGNFYIIYIELTSGELTVYDHTNTNTQIISTLASEATLKFANIVCDYNDDIVLGYYDTAESNEVQIRRLDGGNISSILLDTEFDLGTQPPSMFTVVDGYNNIFAIYTDGSDKEAYYKKYDGSWGTTTKISSDYDGEMVVPELRAPLSSDTILVTYSATQ